MAHKKELSYNLRLLADTPRKATAKSRLLSSSERPYLEDIQEQRLELASYQVCFNKSTAQSTTTSYVPIYLIDAS